MNARPRYQSVTRMPFARIPLIRIYVLVNRELLQMGELALVRGFACRFFLKILNKIKVNHRGEGVNLIIFRRVPRKTMKNNRLRRLRFYFDVSWARLLYIKKEPQLWTAVLLWLGVISKVSQSNKKYNKQYKGLFLRKCMSGGDTSWNTNPK